MALWVYMPVSLGYIPLRRTARLWETSLNTGNLFSKSSHTKYISSSIIRQLVSTFGGKITLKIKTH